MAACLIGIAVSLLVVGLVSGTLLRHIVQVMPVALAAVAARRAPGWGRYAALATCIFWFAIMVLIWLFVLGIATVVGGRFKPIEIALTIVIGACCVAGSAAAVSGRGAKTGRSILVFAAIFILQLAAMWLSFQPAFARDS